MTEKYSTIGFKLLPFPLQKIQPWCIINVQYRYFPGAMCWEFSFWNTPNAMTEFIISRYIEVISIAIRIMENGSDNN